MASIIKDIVNRTNGELYIGVVGSVRSGKSTFIRKFMELKVLPHVIEDKNKIIDELPQSSAGKTIMTVEPKFVPSNPVNITLENEINFNVRLVDCVGYVIENSKGYLNEDGSMKLVNTPWFAEEIPFLEAATLGTKKVMENHSNLGVIVTSDGSFGDFNREDYENIEEKLINEMKELNKPFVLLMNSSEPFSEKTTNICVELENKYNISVYSCDVNSLTEQDVDEIMKLCLNEFDITKLNINSPNWLMNLSDNNKYKQEFNNNIKNVSGKYRKFKEINAIKESFKNFELFNDVVITSIDSGSGVVEMVLSCSNELYYSVIKNLIGDVIEDKGEFIKFLEQSVEAKNCFEKYKNAIESVNQVGYGIAAPVIDDMSLDEPSIIKQGGKFGVKLRALAPSIVMFKVDIESIFEPIIGTEEQSNKLLEKIMNDYDNDHSSIWQAEIFGRKLSEVVNDGVKAKLFMVPDTIQNKMRDCMEKIVNKGKGGVLAIIL